jgi:tetratricopeptide (TPR) repeat protein
LPARRPAAPAVGLVVAAFHVTLAMISFAAGMSSLPVGVARLALTLFIGFLLLEAQGDFVWESVRQRLELDPTSRSSMDYYTQSRYYRRIHQIAKAVLHLERAVELAPERWEFRVALGNAYYAAGQFDRAAEQFGAALQINPAAADVRQFLDTLTARAPSADTRGV